MTDPHSDLSSPGSFREEINPLLNLLLEQNLARWAQVYFATPPAGRDEAVRELLRQLRIEATCNAPTPPATVSSASVPSAPSRPASFAPAPSAAPSAGASVCPDCQSENAPDQQFCGFCGAPFDRERAAEVVTAHPKAAAPADHVSHAETFSFLGLDPNQSDNELQFLREKSFGSEYYEPESHRGRYAIATIAIILAGVSYVEWPLLRSHVPWISQAAASVQRPVTEPSAPQQSTVPTLTAVQPPVANETQAPVFSPPNAGAPEPEGTIAGKTSDAEHAAQPAKPLTLASHTEGTGLPPEGTQELLLAERYLDGRGVPHDSGQAAALLWKAVSKQNTRADVLLADLYMRGDGVPKSCDQARLLLVAAAKKNAPSAEQELRNLESGGCR